MPEGFAEVLANDDSEVAADIEAFAVGAVKPAADVAESGADAPGSVVVRSLLATDVGSLIFALFIYYVLLRVSFN